MTNNPLVKLWRWLNELLHNPLPVPPCRQHKWEWLISKHGGCYHCSVCGKWAGRDNGSWVTF